MNTVPVSLQSRRRLSVLSVLVIVVVSSVLLAVAWQPVLGASQAQTQQSLSPDQLYQSLRTSVVRVESTGDDGIHPRIRGQVPEGIESQIKDMGIPIPDFRARPRTGAGFFIDNDGHIMTNHSIIAGADTIYITFADGAWYTAEVMGADPQSDLAVLRIPDLDHDFTALPLASDNTLDIGDMVFAFGYPESLMGTLTQGMVNSMEIRRTGAGGQLLPYLIQSDAVGLTGLVGSPLVNEYGEAVGITMHMPQHSWNPQTKLSMPIAMVQTVIPALTQGTQHPYPLLGVAGTDLSPAQAVAMAMDNLYQGAYISAVGEDSAAAAAGIQEGDFLTAVNGTPIHTFSGLAHELLVHHTGGEEIQVSVWRDDRALELTITLDTRDTSAS